MSHDLYLQRQRHKLRNIEEERAGGIIPQWEAAVRGGDGSKKMIWSDSEPNVYLNFHKTYPEWIFNSHHLFAPIKQNWPWTELKVNCRKNWRNKIKSQHSATNSFYWSQLLYAGSFEGLAHPWIIYLGNLKDFRISYHQNWYVFMVLNR